MTTLKTITFDALAAKCNVSKSAIRRRVDVLALKIRKVAGVRKKHYALSEHDGKRLVRSILHNEIKWGGRQRREGK